MKRPNSVAIAKFRGWDVAQPRPSNSNEELNSMTAREPLHSPIRLVRKQLAAQGMDVPPREKLTPQALRALQRAEIERWWPILRAENIRAD